MRTLSSSETLKLWERGARWHPLDRALLVLNFAGQSEGESVPDWPLGQRNRALLELYATWFGLQLEAWAACPQCDERLEFQLRVRDLEVAQSADQRIATVTVGEQTFRLPTSRDLAKVTASGDEQKAATALLELCRVSDSGSFGLTDEMIEKVGESLATADPMAETQVSLTCPVCDHEWNDSIDIARFIWAEVEARARRLLWEVHSLASAYGWSESETLALSTERRAQYLQMLHA